MSTAYWTTMESNYDNSQNFEEFRGEMHNKQIFFQDAGSSSELISPALNVTSSSSGKNVVRVVSNGLSSLNTCCPSCNKIVYKAEELLALGLKWHKICFRCGSTSSDGCKRVLAQNSFEVYNGVGFCKGCYSRLVKIAVTGTSAAASINPSYSYSGPVVEKPFDDLGKMSLSGGVARHSSVFSKNETTEISPSTTEKASTGLADMMSCRCPACNVRVYKAEELLAMGFSWHRNCFRCGGMGSLGCQRVLTQHGYEPYAGISYCTACYNRIKFTEQTKKTETVSFVFDPDAPNIRQEELEAVAASVNVADLSSVLGLSMRRPAVTEDLLNNFAPYAIPEGEADAAFPKTIKENIFDPRKFNIIKVEQCEVLPKEIKVREYVELMPNSKSMLKGMAPVIHRAPSVVDANTLSLGPRQPSHHSYTDTSHIYVQGFKGIMVDGEVSDVFDHDEDDDGGDDVQAERRLHDIDSRPVHAYAYPSAPSPAAKKVPKVEYEDAPNPEMCCAAQDALIALLTLGYYTSSREMMKKAEPKRRW